MCTGHLRIGPRLSAALALTVAGCAPSAFVNPEYGRLEPVRVAVAPVANESIHQLDSVTFGGLLQRTLTGGTTYNVPEIMKEALMDALFSRGYDPVDFKHDLGRPEPDFRRPLDPAAERPPFDAYLVCTIEEWQSDKISSSSMHMRYRIEMFKVPTGEVLFSGRFSCGYRDELGEYRFEEVASRIRGSVKRALSALPEAGDRSRG